MPPLLNEESSPAEGDERWRRRADLGFTLPGPRHVTDPTKDQSISSSSRGSSHIVSRARQALVVTFDTSTTRGRTPLVLIPQMIVRCSFCIGPRFGMGLTAHGESHYRRIVVVRVSHWWSCGVLGYKWADQGTPSSRSTVQLIFVKVSWYGWVNHPLMMVH